MEHAGINHTCLFKLNAKTCEFSEVKRNALQQRPPQRSGRHDIIKIYPLAPYFRPLQRHDTSAGDASSPSGG